MCCDLESAGGTACELLLSQLSELSRVLAHAIALWLGSALEAGFRRLNANRHTLQWHPLAREYGYDCTSRKYPKNQGDAPLR